MTDKLDRDLIKEAGFTNFTQYSGFIGKMNSIPQASTVKWF